MNYVYNCQGKEKILRDDQETVVEHKKYFCVKCSDCCTDDLRHGKTVLHMLERKDS